MSDNSSFKNENEVKEHACTIMSQFSKARENSFSKWQEIRVSKHCNR